MDDRFSVHCQVDPGVEPHVPSGMCSGIARRPAVFVRVVHQRVHDVLVPRWVVRHCGHGAPVHGGLHACVQHMGATKDGMWWGFGGEREQWRGEV